jgi:tetratricopeptide (TPR) repeat protein
MRLRTGFSYIALLLSIVVANSITLTLAQEQTESDHVLPLKDSDCQPLKKAGAQFLQVRIIDNHNAWLEGVKDTQVIWKKRFPLSEEVNRPKAYAECEKGSIELYSEAPFCTYTTTQEFAWDGITLKYLTITHADPSADALEEYIQAAEDGDEKVVNAGPDQIMYPSHYIEPAIFPTILKRVEHKAKLAYKNKQALQAAIIIKCGFNALLNLAQVSWGIQTDEKNKTDVDRWLAFCSSEEAACPLGAYLPAVNDYAFYLQEAGNCRDALPIFQRVVKLDSTRTLCYLNLADAEWKLGQKVEAKQDYKRYYDLMVKDRHANLIPERVKQRMQVM